MVDPGLITAFKADADGDLGHKLETAVFLECRRHRKAWRYWANGGEVDLCDAEGTVFFNACWSHGDADTARREAEAMALGARRLPSATGRLLYHEHAPDIVRRIPGAIPAWRWMLEQKAGI